MQLVPILPINDIIALPVKVPLNCITSLLKLSPIYIFINWRHANLLFTSFIIHMRKLEEFYDEHTGLASADAAMIKNWSLLSLIKVKLGLLKYTQEHVYSQVDMKSKSSYPWNIRMRVRVRVRMRVRVHIYTYTHIHIHIYTYTHIHTYTYTYTYSYVRIRIHIFPHFFVFKFRLILEQLVCNFIFPFFLGLHHCQGRSQY